MPWLVALAVLVIFTCIQIATARRWRPLLPEHVIHIVRSWPWSPKEPPYLMSREDLLFLGPFGAILVGGLGGIFSGLFHVLWGTGLTVLVELWWVWETSWTLNHTIKARKQRPTTTQNGP